MSSEHLFLESIDDERDNGEALFNRVAWFKLFEKYVPLQNSQPTTLVFDNNIHLPLQQSHQGFKLLGKGHYLHSLSNYYSPFFGPLLSTEQCIDVVSQARDFFITFDRIDMLPMYAEQAQNWQLAFAKIGFKGFIYKQSINWYHENIESVEHYWSLRPSRLRNTLKRKRDKLERDSQYRIEIARPESRTELNKLLIDYHHVYFDSWKQVEPVPAFIDAIAHYAWQQNELRLGVLYHGENPVAAQIWFVNNDIAYIYKLAYRKSYSEQSVGTVLSAALFDHVIGEDKVTCIDFLTGDDDYKKDWMQSSRPLYGVQLCNSRSLVGNLNSVRNVVSGMRKKWNKY